MCKGGRGRPKDVMVDMKKKRSTGWKETTKLVPSKRD